MLVQVQLRQLQETHPCVAVAELLSDPCHWVIDWNIHITPAGSCTPHVHTKASKAAIFSGSVAQQVFRRAGSAKSVQLLHYSHTLCDRYQGPQVIFTEASQEDQ